MGWPSAAAPGLPSRWSRSSRSARGAAESALLHQPPSTTRFSLSSRANREGPSGSQHGLHVWAGDSRLRGLLQKFTLSDSVVQAKPRYRGYHADPATATAVSRAGCTHPSSSGHSFRGGTYPAESVEPAAAGAASPCYETGWFKTSTHLVYSGLPVALEIGSEGGEEGFLLASGVGKERERYFACFCSVETAIFSLGQTYLMCWQA